jgi:hypothetical protein
MITIIGSGMAGLLAGNMLSRNAIRIIEAQKELPNNHSAVLRFRSSVVSDVLGIPFKKVKLIKSYLPWKNRVADSLSYAHKCSGISRSDRSIITEEFAAERWIAPPDLIEQMAQPLIGAIEFGKTFTDESINTIDCSDPIISTMPMPVLMKLLGYKDAPNFNYVGGANVHLRISDCDAYASLYVPDPLYKFNRASITGDDLCVEYSFPSHLPDNQIEWLDKNKYSEAYDAAQLFGFHRSRIQSISLSAQRYAKIQPIDENARKAFIAWATDNFNIFSLGRFATWRPGLLLDDLVHDVRLVQKWINSDRYSMKFHR